MPGGRPPRCLICANPPLKGYVDDGLNKGLSNAGIAHSFEAAGGKLDPDVIGRHKKGHWTKPADPDSPKPTKRDLAIMVRDKIADAVDGMTGEGMILMGKEIAPALNAGLKAEQIIDKRAATDKKLGIAAGALALQAWLAGLGGSAPPPELDDGLTVEGKAVEIE